MVCDIPLLREYFGSQPVILEKDVESAIKFLASIGERSLGGFIESTFTRTPVRAVLQRN